MKKLISFILMLVILASFLNVTSMAAKTTKDIAQTGVVSNLEVSDAPNVSLDSINGKVYGYFGDVDGDNLITVLDATEIQLRCAELSYDFSTYGEFLADVDDDERITVIDAAEIQKYCAEKVITTLVGYVLYEPYDDPPAQNTNYKYKVSANNNSSVIVDNVMYYCDSAGIWKKEIGKNDVRLSSNRGWTISSNGELVIYTTTLNSYETSIRCVNSDGSGDKELCQVESYANNMIIVDNNLFYTCESQKDGANYLYCYNLSTKKTKEFGVHISAISTPVNNKIVYLDTGNGYSSLDSRLHLFDLTNGTDTLLSSNAYYYEELYQEGDNVYTIKQAADGYYLCEYNLKTNTQKDLRLLLPFCDQGLNPLAIIDNEFYYAVVNSSVSFGIWYDYYKYDVANDKIYSLASFPTDNCYIVESQTQDLCVFGDVVYSLNGGDLVKLNTSGVQYYNVMEYFDSKVYYYNYDKVKSVKIYSTNKQMDPSQLVVENYLGCTINELTKVFGTDYETTTLSGGGATKYIVFKSFDCVAFGIPSGASAVEFITVLDPSVHVNLYSNIYSDMTVSDLLALKSTDFTVEESYLEINDTILISLNFKNGLYIGYEWSSYGYENNTTAGVAHMSYR